MKFVTFLLLVCSASLSGAALHSSWYDVENRRYSRGAPSSPAPSGPVSTVSRNGNETVSVDECPAGTVSRSGSANDASKHAAAADHSGDRCTFDRKPGQILTALKNAGTDEIAGYKSLSTSSCGAEEECKKLCESLQCNYFIKSTRAQKLPLTFFYSIDEQLLKPEQFSFSTIYTSYVRTCASKRSKRGKLFQPAPAQPIHPLDGKQFIAEKVNLPHFDYFKQFLHVHHKWYHIKTEYNAHEKTFYKNVKRIDDLNEEARQRKEKDKDKDKKDDDSKYSVTKFADETYAEFVHLHTGALPEPPNAAHPLTIHDMGPGIGGHPKKLDWRRDGKVGKVRNQGSCGACYAFTIADLVAIQTSLETKGNAKTMSPQYIMDCLTENRGGQGARVGKVLQNVAGDDRGVHLEQCYRYKEQAGTCQKSSQCCMYSKIKWSEMVDASGPGEKDVMAALLRWGPLIAIVEASEAWQFYNGTGIIKAHQCKGQQNHAVLIVGYNHDDGVTPHYLIRNSWSDDWGDGGYAKLEAGTNACFVAKNVMTACARDCDKVKDAKARLVNIPHY